jgi:hypothetical protein
VPYPIFTLSCLRVNTSELRDCLQACGDKFLQTPRGYEKYDQSTMGKMDIELPMRVKESCLLLQDVSSNEELFQKYCAPGQNIVPHIELHSFLKAFHDLGLLGKAQHQISSDFVQTVFKKIAGRWAKDATFDLFIKCLCMVQEYLIFRALHDRNVEALSPMKSYRGGVTFR